MAPDKFSGQNHQYFTTYLSALRSVHFNVLFLAAAESFRCILVLTRHVICTTELSAILLLRCLMAMLLKNFLFLVYFFGIVLLAVAAELEIGISAAVTAVIVLVEVILIQNSKGIAAEEGTSVSSQN